MRIFVAVTLFLLVILIVADDVSAKKLDHEKFGKNKHASINEETNNREKDGSTSHRKKHKNIKNQEKSHDRKRRTIVDIELEDTNEDNTSGKCQSSEDKCWKKLRTTGQKNQNRRVNEKTSKNKKIDKQDKQLDSESLRFMKKSRKSSIVEKQSSSDDSIDSDESSDRCGWKTCSENSSSEEPIEKRRNFNYEENENEEKKLIDERSEKKLRKSVHNHQDNDEESICGKNKNSKNKRTRVKYEEDNDDVTANDDNDEKIKKKMKKRQRCTCNEKNVDNKSKKLRKKCWNHNPVETDSLSDFQGKNEKSTINIESSNSEDLNSANEEEEMDEDEQEKMAKKDESTLEFCPREIIDDTNEDQS